MRSLFSKSNAVAINFIKFLYSRNVVMRMGGLRLCCDERMQHVACATLCYVLQPCVVLAGLRSVALFGVTVMLLCGLCFGCF